MTIDPAIRFAEIERHLLAIGAAPGQPIPVDEIERRVARPLPAVLGWLFSRFGGFRFGGGGACYRDPTSHVDVMLGWFLDHAEIVDALASWGEGVPPHMLPIANDGADDFLLVELDPSPIGAVHLYVHWGTTSGLRVEPVSPSLETFLLSLRAAR